MNTRHRKVYMKRIILGAYLLFFSCNAYAGTISIQPFISNNDVTIQALETQRTTISNVINGNIEGGINIKAGSLVSADFSNAVSPVTRWDESFTDFTVTGMLAPTSVSLTSATTAGTSYVDGFRVVVGSTAHTYTASKDTYVFIHDGGYYVYQETSNGGAQPSTPTNTLLLFKAISSATAITTVTDLRTLGISLTNTSSIVPINFRDNLSITSDGVSTITVQPGSCEVNSTRVTKTTPTVIATNSVTFKVGAKGVGYGYVGIDVSGNIGVATTAPTNSDYALTSTLGKKRYATWDSSTVYRILGWFYMTNGTPIINNYECSNIREYDVPNTTATSATAQVSNASAIYADDTSATMHFYSSGNPLYVEYNCGVGNSGSSMTRVTVSVDAAGILGTDRGTIGFTSSAITEIWNVSSIYQSSTVLQGTHTIQGRFNAQANTGYVNQRTMKVREE